MVFGKLEVFEGELVNHRVDLDHGGVDPMCHESPGSGANAQSTVCY